MKLIGILLAVVRRLDAADDDVGGAELLDLLDGLEAGRLADGQHDDHRGHAEHDAEHGQHGPQLVARPGCAG